MKNIAFFDYQFWATELLLKRFDEIAVIPDKSLALMSHIFNAQEIWIARLNGRAHRFPVFHVHEKENLWNLFHDLKPKIFEALQHENYEEIIHYSSTEGIAYASTRDEIFFHLSNHSTYHHAQINQNLVLNGLKPVSIDFIVFSRKHL